MRAEAEADIRRVNGQEPVPVGGDAVEPDGIGVFLVPIPALPDVWPKVSHLVQQAVDRAHGEETAEDVLAQCAHNLDQLWIVLRGPEIVAAAVTCLLVHPRRRAVKVIYVAGEDMSEWIGHLKDTLADWARQNGCDAIEAIGRHGWKTALSKQGFKPAATLYHLDLER